MKVARRRETAPPDGPIGLLLVGHGAADPQAMAEFSELCRRAARRLPEALVEQGCLELASPTIEEAMGRLAGRGVRRAVAVPLLLLAARHVRRDIPEAVQGAASRWGVSVRLAEHLGCGEAVLELSALRFRQALGRDDGPSWRETAWVLASRGTRDSAALAEIRRFLELRRRRTPVGAAEIGFLAMASPPLPAVLTRLARRGFRRIVVQPHLLFPGRLLQRFREIAAAAAAEFPDRQWRTAGHLGGSKGLVHAVADRYEAVRPWWRREAGRAERMCLG